MISLNQHILKFRLHIHIFVSLKQALKSLNEAQDMQLWIEKVKIWLKEQYLPESGGLHGENMSKNQFEYEQIADGDLPIWLAAQRAVSRYEGLLSPLGPRGRLIRRLLTWIGLIPSLPKASIDFDDDDKYLETYLRLVLVKLYLPVNFIYFPTPISV